MLTVRRPRFTTLLAAAVVGVYLLVIAGATAALAETARACSTWPLCRGTLSPATAIALGHRAAAAVVGLLVLWTAVRARREGASRRVRGAIGVAFVLYPLQIAVGAVIALAQAPPALSSLHLLAGMAIFVGLVLALAWQLEIETGDPDDEPRGFSGTAPPPSADLGGSGSSVGSVSSAGSADTSTTTGRTSGRTSDAAASVPDADPGTPSEMSGSPHGGRLARASATVRSYLSLTKPRLMWLLCLVASAGMALAAGPDLSAQTVAATLGGGVLAIGAAGTFNHVLERDADQRMARTSNRPLATRRVSVRNALAFGGALTVLSLVAFLQVNLLAAALGLAAILFYSVVYTLVLKPNTVQNTVLGGAAGALPALIGWAAVTGHIGLPGLALAGVIFLWTPAHFYNLALAYRDDYERGGFPMLPVVRGETVTRKHVLLYLGATLLGASTLAAVTSLGWVYAATSVALGAAFLWAVVRLHRERTDAAAFRAFHASNAYLGLLLVAVVLDSLVL